MKVRNSSKVKQHDLKGPDYSVQKSLRKDGKKDSLAESSKKDTISRRLALKTKTSLPNGPQLEKRPALRQSRRVDLSLFSFEKEKFWKQKIPVFFIAYGADSKRPTPVNKATENELFNVISEAEDGKNSLVDTVSLAALFPKSLGGMTHLGSIRTLSRAGLSRGTVNFLIRFDPSWGLEERQKRRIMAHAIFGGLLRDFQDKRLENWILNNESGHLNSWVAETIVTFATGGNERLVSFFLDRWKANPNAAEYDHGIVVSALWRAVVTDSVDMVRLLLERGADPLFSEEVRGRSFNKFSMIYVPWDFVERDYSGTKIVQRPEILRLMRESIETSGRPVPESTFWDDED